MKILHCCLANNFLDNHAYQENVLIKMHKLMSYDVEVVASTEVVSNTSSIEYTTASTYVSLEGVKITRLPYVGWLPHLLALKLRVYSHLDQFLNECKPDIIFIHGVQFLSIKNIASYVAKNPDTVVYADNHADMINSGTTWVSRNIFHRIIYKWCAKKILPFTRKFYGVLPIRVDFLTDVYGIPASKVELLELGADLTNVDLRQKDDIRKKIRSQLDVGDNDLLMITGGKIDKRKKIDLLMRKIVNLNIPHIKLIVFGTPSDELKEEIATLSKHGSIRNIGWIASENVYNYYLAADLAVFPGTHSVLWEQAVGTGLPCIFKRWEGMQHVDVGGNCLFYNHENELDKLILHLYNNREELSKMRQIAMEKGMKQFSYYDIARRAIET